MHRASLPVRIFALLGALALFVLAGGGALAAADDYLNREILPAGSMVGGVDVSGLSRAEAQALVESEIAAPLAEPITVTYGDRTFPLDAGSMIAVDVEGMVEAAFRPKYDSSLPERVSARLMRASSGGVAELAITLDEAKLDEWLTQVAASVDTTPCDAAMTVEAGTMVTVPSRRGETVSRKETADALAAALTAGVKSVALVVDITEPQVTEESLGTAILVDISERELYLYDKGQLVKQYGVAVGTAGHPTPRGDFYITLKRYRPTWSNPGSDWAKGMPSTIPPGPNNPLGTRALNINSPGIRIHGTSNDASIGTAASHGCMRMHRWDVEDLYERVEVGTPVFIVR